MWILHLFIVLITLLIDNIEESELVGSLASSDDTEPVTELLLLEELLGPAVVSLDLPSSEL